MVNLFLNNGYADMQSIINIPVPFIFITGARGTGKTYGALSSVLDMGCRFIFMRRTQNQIDIINKPEFSPFKKLNADKQLDIGVFPVSKNSSAFYHTYEDDNGTLKPKGTPLGYTLALSTISNMRGFDMSDVELIIFDEFIPEKHERLIKGEGDAFLNAYETINRNRELDGKPPLKIVCLSNSNTLDNPIFTHLKLVDVAVRMQEQHKPVYINKQRGVALISLLDSPISQMKADTALYNLTDNSTFRDMALSNMFSIQDADLIKKCPVKEFRPVCNVGELGIYKHKYNDMYYVCMMQSSTVSYDTGDAELRRFRRDNSKLWLKFYDKKVFFESQICRTLFVDYFQML